MHFDAVSVEGGHLNYLSSVQGGAKGLLCLLQQGWFEASLLQ